MTTPSALFQMKVGDADWLAPGQKAVAATGDRIRCRIADIEGVDKVTWEFHGLSRTEGEDPVPEPTVTLEGVPLGAEMWFDVPENDGGAWGLTGHVNGGAQRRGQIVENADYTKRSVVVVPFSTTGQEAVFIGETFENDSVFAAVARFNWLLKRAPIGGLVSALGLDGVDVVLDAGALEVRRSKDFHLATLAADIHDYTHAEWDTCDIAVLTPTGANRLLTSAEPPTAGGTTSKIVINGSSTLALTLPHDSTSGTAGKRFWGPSLDPVTLGPGAAAIINWRSDIGYWQIIFSYASNLANVGGGAEVYKEDSPAGKNNLRTLTGSGGIGVEQGENTINFNGELFALAAQGLDGINSAKVGQTIVTRRSRDSLPIAWSVDVDDFTHEDWDTCDDVRVSLVADVVWSGADEPSADGTTEKTVSNLSSEHSLTLPHDALSTTQKRFSAPGGVPYVLGPLERCKIRYSFTANRWEVIDRAQGEDVSVASTAGFGALGAMRRLAVNYDDDANHNAGSCRYVWIPLFAKWLRLAQTGFDGPPSDQVFTGAIDVDILSAPEGGETSAALWQTVNPESWGPHNLGSIPGTSNAVYPFKTEVFPWNGGVRLVVIHGISAGGPTAARVHYTDDCATTWTTGALASASELSPHDVIWSGEALLVSFPDGSIQRSTDGAATWTLVYDGEGPGDKPPMRIGMSDGAGTVVFASHGFALTTHDHGITWARWDKPPPGFNPTQARWFKGKYYIWTQANNLHTSEDGDTWSEEVALDWGLPGTRHMLPNIGDGLVNCGDLLVVFAFEELDFSETKDLYFSTNGVTWEPSNVFGYLLAAQPLSTLPAGSGSSTSSKPKRVNIACTTPRSPAHLPAHWHQLVVVPSTDQETFADAYLGPRDSGGTIVTYTTEGANVYASPPPAVGGAPSAGISDQWSRGDARPDLGRIAPTLPSAATLAVGTADGDFIPVSGTVPTTAFTVPKGIRRELYCQTTGWVIEANSSVLTPHGLNLFLRAGDRVVLRAWDDDKVYVRPVDDQADHERVGSIPLLRFKHNRTTSAPPLSGEVRYDNVNPQAATAIYIHNGNWKNGSVGDMLRQSSRGNILVYATGATWTLYSYTSATEVSGTYTAFTGLTLLDGEGIEATWDSFAPDGAPVNVQVFPTTQTDQETASFEFTAVGSSVLYEAPDDTELKRGTDYIYVSAETLDAGNQGLAIQGRMSRYGGIIYAERVGVPTDNLQFRVGPPRNRTTHVEFPVLDAWSTSNAGDMSKLFLTAGKLSTVTIESDRRIHVDFDPSGHHMLLGVRDSNTHIEQWYCSTPFKQETASFVHRYDTSALDLACECVRWGHDGTYVYWFGAVSLKLYKYDCGSAYNLAGGSHSGTSLDVSVSSFDINSDGSSLAILFSSTAYHYAGTPGDVTSFAAVGGDSIDLVAATAGGTAVFAIALHPADDNVLFAASVSGSLGAPTLVQFHKLQLTGDTVMVGAVEVGSPSADFSGTFIDSRSIAVSYDAQYVYIGSRTNQLVYRLSTVGFNNGNVYRLVFLPRNADWYQVAAYPTNEGDVSGVGDADGNDWLFLFPNVAPTMRDNTSQIYKWTLEWGFDDGYGGAQRMMRAGTFIVTKDSSDIASFHWKTEEQPQYLHSTGFINFEVGPSAVLLAADHGDAGLDGLRILVTFQDYDNPDIVGPAYLNVQLVSTNPLWFE